MQNSLNWRPETHPASVAICVACTNNAWQGNYLYDLVVWFFYLFWALLQDLWDHGSPSEIKPMPPAVGAQNPDHWATNKVPELVFKRGFELIWSSVLIAVNNDHVCSELCCLIQ